MKERKEDEEKPRKKPKAMSRQQIESPQNNPLELQRKLKTDNITGCHERTKTKTMRERELEILEVERGKD